MTQRRVENTRVHFVAKSPVSVNNIMYFLVIYENIRKLKAFGNMVFKTNLS